MWLSLVERTVRDGEVVGSNPVIPTDEKVHGCHGHELFSVWLCRYLSKLSVIFCLHFSTDKKHCFCHCNPSQYINNTVLFEKKR